ncbi:HsdM family class I SAM-dependent methyltransferase [Desulfolutivibrio sulfoxidireducens]|uniref:HsdM family class I SAM-dependent methyltransferase n=1 Tax=Desulfolutivibrio sulfoxidireducens TaxID=2773299 RepID=UPI00159E1604|nr:N-6 DNA methylase [Desulfolutivibrio sulfoxidireducens]QLA16481.1 N-6 DNA methylase [Desulfolutivibrio sulfoxidireducens]
MEPSGARENKVKKLWQSFAPGKDQLLFFDNSSEYLAEYQDIRRSPDVASCILGVVEHNARPLIYITSSDSLTERRNIDIDKICHLLACRGEKSFLAVISAGVLTLYPCILKDGSQTSPSFPVEKIPSIIRGLSEGIIPPELSRADKQLRDINLRKRLLNAFINAANSLRNVEGLSRHNDPQHDHDRLSIILALLGRVLFMCFLCDRDLVPAEFGPKRQNPYDKFTLFSENINAASIFHWQDVTFNGDFLPIFSDKAGALPTSDEYINFFNENPVLDQIQAFTNGEDTNRPSLIRLLNFQHVPIGLLSEVYETFAHNFFETTAHATSIHYTPRHVAAVMVDQAFQGISHRDRGNIRMLDPAAGAGVFLVLSLRRIIQEKSNQGKEINAALIRSVLYNQICGMDISLHALHLSTLALYLAAIDLDPNPTPVTKQHFDTPLLGSVVHHVDDSYQIGALGSKGSSDAINGPFDLIIGNPPWTKVSGNERQRRMRDATLQTALRVRPTIHKDLSELQYSADQLSPDFNPAFPFLWRSMEWAKDHGIIALVLPAEQILFREHASRNILFRNLTVTGIVNGADLHKSDFWDGMSEPFCLFFARNTIPSPNSTFLYLNVFVESLTAQQHHLRLDGSQSKNISISWLEDVPFLLKTLFRGSELDLAILEKMQRTTTILFKDFFNSKGISLCNGYSIKGVADDADPTIARKKQQIQLDNYATLRKLNGLHIRAGCLQRSENPLLDDKILPEFNSDTKITHVDASRNTTIYRPPLVVIPQAAKQDVAFYIGSRNVIYTQSHFGVSLFGVEEAEHIATYLTIVFLSKLPRYYSLLTSARYGCNWNTVLLKEYEQFPIVPWDTLESRHKDFCISTLAHWKKGELVSFSDIFSWASELYHLNKYDQRVIRDTLNTKDPGARKKAQSLPSPQMQNYFISYINNEIKDLGNIYDTKFNLLTSSVLDTIPGWLFSSIYITDDVPCTAKFNPQIVTLCAEIANHEGCSQIILPDHKNKLIWFGLLAQQRYWTYSQARLFSQRVKAEIDRNRLDWGIQ